MNKILENFIDSFSYLSQGISKFNERKSYIILRSANFSKLSNSMVKVAMDMRRIDKLEVGIPRRGLQDWERSDPMITTSMADKIQAFTKLKDTLEIIKAKFGSNPEYHDSHVKFIHRNLDNALRTNIKDGDFSENQSSLGSLNYINDILFIRYGMNADLIKDMPKEEIERIILAKDKQIIYDEKPVILSAKKVDVPGYDALVQQIEELKKMVIGNIYKPSSPGDGLKELFSNPKEERTITITIKDK